MVFIKFKLNNARVLQSVASAGEMLCANAHSLQQMKMLDTNMSFKQECIKNWLTFELSRFPAKHLELRFQKIKGPLALSFLPL
jgi:hypothetical protein